MTTKYTVKYIEETDYESFKVYANGAFFCTCDCEEIALYIIKCLEWTDEAVVRIVKERIERN